MALDATIQAAGANSYLLEVPARDEAQEAAFRSLFDRREAYANFTLALKEATKSLSAASEADVRRTLRQLDAQLQTVLASDFFAGQPAEKAQAALKTLRTEVERRWSPNEPSGSRNAITRLDTTDFQGRTWATRARPWVDRLATAWLITRFVDRRPQFLWLSNVQKAPVNALGFDYDGAHFTHVGTQANLRVSFEVVMASFGLEGIPGLQRLGALVHVLDVGGMPIDEAPGLELMVRGLQAMHSDDDALLTAAVPLFDALLSGLSIDLNRT